MEINKNLIHQLKEKNEINLLGKNLIFTTNEYLIEQLKSIKLFSLTYIQYNILQILSDNYPNSTSVNNVYNLVLDRKANVSRIAETLFLRGLLTKTKAINDKRIINLNITQKGVQLLIEIENYKGNNIKKQKMDNSEINNFHNLLNKFRNFYSQEN